MNKKIKTIRESFKKDIKQLDVDSLHIKYLGKNGKINILLKEILQLSNKDKRNTAQKINKLKKTIEEEILTKRQNEPIEQQKNIDLTIPVEKTKTGNLHPLTIVTRQLNQFFHYYGFSVADGPEIEDDYHNFEMMGVPKDHPARELQDTLYIMEPEILLRTQASSIEARYLEENELPIRVVAPGKVFRNETVNKTNSALFHHYQGFYVDRNVTLGHLKWIFEKVLKAVLGKETETRFRSKYYPEVEPGLSPDIKCTFCKGTGCDVCKQRGWIEIAGGGMIHPNTLQKAGINHKEYSGFAFGFGLDRIAMTRFSINDIRVLFNGKIVYR